MALLTAQPVMVTVEEEEDVAAFSVRLGNLLWSYFLVGCPVVQLPSLIFPCWHCVGFRPGCGVALSLAQRITYALLTLELPTFSAELTEMRVHCRLLLRLQRQQLLNRLRLQLLLRLPQRRRQ
jgi:hypothetical protein